MLAQTLRAARCVCPQLSACVASSFGGRAAERLGVETLFVRTYQRGDGNPFPVACRVRLVSRRISVAVCVTLTVFRGVSALPPPSSPCRHTAVYRPPRHVSGDDDSKFDSYYSSLSVFYRILARRSGRASRVASPCVDRRPPRPSPQSTVRKRVKRPPARGEPDADLGGL